MLKGKIMRNLKTLLQEQRGAIVVPALALSPLLVAACWYQIRVWTSIVQRESVQTAADAIAAGGAAWLASGMNLLALVNVVMSIILTVFVAIRAAELLAVGAAILFAGLAFIPSQQWAVAASVKAAEFAEKAFRAEQKVAPKIMKTLNLATDVERNIARAVPYVSMAMSITYGPQSSSVKRDGIGIAGNLSVLPTGADRAIPKAPPRMGAFDEVDDFKGVKYPDRVRDLLGDKRNLLGSLPVEAEDYYQLCSRTVGDWTTLPGIRDLPAADKMGLVADFLGGNFGDLLCRPVSQTQDLLKSKLDDEVGKAVSSKGDQVAKEICDKKAEDQGWANQKNLNLAKKQRNCLRGEKGRWKGSDDGKKFEKEHRDQAKARIDSLQKASESVETIKTAKIWNFVDNSASALETGMDDLDSNAFLDAYSLYMGESIENHAGVLSSPFLKMLTDQCKGCTETLESFEPDISSARARIFFDCDSRDLLRRDSGAGSIHSCSDNSLWRPGGWMWVLGVDKSPGEVMRGTAEQALKGYIGNLAGNVFQERASKVLGWAVDRFVKPGRNTFYGQWKDRVWGTISPEQGNGTAGHFSSWWIDDTAGNAAQKVWQGEPQEKPKPYWR